MRITPVILIFIGIFGLLYPEKLLADPHSMGRWVFVIIIGLGVTTIWRNYRRTKRDKKSSND